MLFHRHVWVSLEKDIECHPDTFFSAHVGDYGTPCYPYIYFDVRRICAKCYLEQSREGRNVEWYKAQLPKAIVRA